MHRISQVLLISIDNLRPDCISANPDKSLLDAYNLAHFPNTPTLDGLVEQGVFFSRCFSSAPYTTASHASILTGVFQSKHGIREYFRYGLSNEVKTLFEVFKSAGYITILATDFPFLIGSHLDFTRSVDFFIQQDDHRVFQILNENQSKRIFAFVHFGAVHNPFGLSSLEVDGDYFVNQVDTLAEKVGVPPQSMLDRSWLEKRRSTPERLLRQRYLKAISKLYEQGRYGEIMELYTQGIEYFDKNRFSVFINNLRELGWLDEGLITVIADHGEEYSTRADGHYNSLCEGVVNVPLIFKGPDIPEGKTHSFLCRTVDLAPTLCDLAGLKVDGNLELQFDGISLKPYFHGAGKPNLCAYGETWFGYADHLMDFMVLCESSGQLLKSRDLAVTRIEYTHNLNWKLLVVTDLVSNEETFELYNLSKYRREHNNIADSEPDLVREMKLDILTHRRSLGEDRAIYIQKNEISKLADSLRDIGYRIPNT